MAKPILPTKLLLSTMLALMLSGCVVSAAKSVVTAPFKIAGKAVDVMTTSQSEADENLGRAMRKREAELGKLGRKLEEREQDCTKGDRDACEEARKIDDEIAELRADPV